MAMTKADMLVFDSGAQRESKDGKLDIEASVHPAVLERYAQYLHDNSFLPDGSRRPNDNWQKGIPLESYMKSMCRHFLDVWKLHRGWKAHMTLENALCAVMFNASGYLYELLRKREQVPQQMELQL